MTMFPLLQEEAGDPIKATTGVLQVQITAVLEILLHNAVATDKMVGQGHLGAAIKTPPPATPQATETGSAKTTVFLL
jgi:hypothetical protein